MVARVPFVRSGAQQVTEVARLEVVAGRATIWFFAGASVSRDREGWECGEWKGHVTLWARYDEHASKREDGVGVERLYGDVSTIDKHVEAGHSQCRMGLPLAPRRSLVSASMCAEPQLRGWNQRL